MEKNNFIIISEVYRSLKEEQDNILQKVNQNLSRIEEIEKYLQSLLEKENTDYKVFSPRTVETIYKDQIDSCNSEKFDLEKENKIYYKQINKIGRYINDLENVLKEDKQEQPEEKKLETNNVNLQIIDIQEKERQRIARDLHDITLQNLTHIVHKLELSSAFMDQDLLRAKLELAAIQKNLRTTISDIRNIIFDLRPMSFDDLGLKDSLTNFFANLKTESDFQILTQIDDISFDNEIIQITIFRVIQEACMNAINHSGGNILEVEVKSEHTFYYIKIHDNGKGFDVDHAILSDNRHFGLEVMKERIQLLNGEMNIVSYDEYGTEIMIQIPKSS